MKILSTLNAGVLSVLFAVNTVYTINEHQEQITTEKTETIFSVYLLSNKDPQEALKEFHECVASSDLITKYNQLCSSPDVQHMNDAGRAAAFHAMLSPDLQKELRITSLSQPCQSSKLELERVLTGLAVAAVCVGIDRMTGGHVTAALVAVSSDAWKSIPKGKQDINDLSAKAALAFLFDTKKMILSSMQIAYPGVMAYLSTGKVQDALFCSGVAGTKKYLKTSLVAQLGDNAGVRAGVGIPIEALGEVANSYKFGRNIDAAKILVNSTQTTVINETSLCTAKLVNKKIPIGEVVVGETVSQALFATKRSLLPEPRFLGNLTMKKSN